MYFFHRKINQTFVKIQGICGSYLILHLQTTLQIQTVYNNYRHIHINSCSYTCSLHNTMTKHLSQKIKCKQHRRRIVTTDRSKPCIRHLHNTLRRQSSHAVIFTCSSTQCSDQSKQTNETQSQRIRILPMCNISTMFIHSFHRDTQTPPELLMFLVI